MLNAETYDLTQYLQGAIFQYAYRHTIESMNEGERHHLSELPALLQLRRGYAESPGWMLVQVEEFLPEPLSVEKFRRRAVYSAPGLVFALLELLASEKWLDRRGDDYYLTEAGRVIIEQMHNRRQRILGVDLPVAVELLIELEADLRQILNTALRSADPPGQWCLAHSRNRMPDPDSSILLRIVAHCTDFNAFRDDCHMAAYRPLEIEGHVWEAFAHVVNGDAHTAQALFDRLAYRGFSQSDLRLALEGLETRGWITNEGDHAFVTDLGRETFAEVERLTDDYFFASWRTLGDSRIEAIVDRMKEIITRCRPSTE